MSRWIWIRLVKGSLALYSIRKQCIDLKSIYQINKRKYWIHKISLIIININAFLFQYDPRNVIKWAIGIDIVRRRTTKYMYLMTCHVWPMHPQWSFSTNTYVHDNCIYMGTHSAAMGHEIWALVASILHMLHHHKRAN